MLKIVQHLIKSRPNSLSLGKSWEVALVSLVPQGFKIPLQSEDTALFQRDWDGSYLAGKASKLRRKTLPCSKGIETAIKNRLTRLACSRKTLPCSKGIETPYLQFGFPQEFLSEDTALFQRDWDSAWPSKLRIILTSEDTALFQRDWDSEIKDCAISLDVSEDTALFQRDWDTGGIRSMLSPSSEDTALFQRDH